MKSRLMTVLALFVLAALAGADDPQAAVKTPDTPAGRLFAGWLGAHRRASRKPSNLVITENYSKDVLSRGTAAAGRRRGSGSVRRTGGPLSWPESSAPRPTNWSPWSGSR